MDIIAVQEAKKVKKMVGNLNELETENKGNAVEAINELKRIVLGNNFVCHETIIHSVDTDEVRAFYMTFDTSCFIKGIKCTGNELAGEFSLKIFTKHPDDGGNYIYYSGKIINIIWDTMEIPFSDESDDRTIYVVLTNKGAMSNFVLQIYTAKG